ncbi:hypothetical protein Bcen2424_6511 [Burkholderia cenocepacia HI2424]|nr:hypothetical protein Bcen2424_6511 [Burkholderia cenocepacia HI2424]
MKVKDPCAFIESPDKWRKGRYDATSRHRPDIAPGTSGDEAGAGWPVRLRTQRVFSRFWHCDREPETKYFCYMKGDSIFQESSRVF